MPLTTVNIDDKNNLYLKKILSDNDDDMNSMDGNGGTKNGDGLDTLIDGEQEILTLDGMQTENEQSLEYIKNIAIEFGIDPIKILKWNGNKNSQNEFSQELVRKLHYRENLIPRTHWQKYLDVAKKYSMKGAAVLGSSIAVWAFARGTTNDDDNNNDNDSNSTNKKKKRKTKKVNLSIHDDNDSMISQTSKLLMNNEQSNSKSIQYRKTDVSNKGWIRNHPYIFSIITLTTFTSVYVGYKLYYKNNKSTSTVYDSDNDNDTKTKNDDGNTKGFTKYLYDIKDIFNATC